MILLKIISGICMGFYILGVIVPNISRKITYYRVSKICRRNIKNQTDPQAKADLEKTAEMSDKLRKQTKIFFINKYEE